MSTVAMGAKGRWTAAAIGAAATGALLLMLFHTASLPSPPVMVAPDAVVAPRPAPAISTSPVELARPDATNAALLEETMMRDLAPLFLPTERNASLKRPPLREPGETFLDTQELKLAFTESAPNIAQDFPAIATLNGRLLRESRPLDVLRTEVAAPALLGFGRDPVAVPTLRPRGGFIEVVASTSVRRVLAEPLPVEARPPTDQLWEPLEFMAAVDPAGLVAPLAVSRSSRVEEIDNHYKNFLVNRYRIGERLAPGFYRITVAP